jgi:excisionase family DNA binding protein
MMAAAALEAQEPKTYLTVREAALYLRVSEGWLYRQAESRSIPCVRIAGRRNIRFRRADLDRWMEGHLEKRKG